MSDAEGGLEWARKVLEAEAEQIVENALDRLEQVYYENGGDAWVVEEPRYHFWKGQDELFSATHHSKDADIEQMDERVEDGVNHLLMASYIAHMEAGSDE